MSFANQFNSILFDKIPLNSINFWFHMGLYGWYSQHQLENLNNARNIYSASSYCVNDTER